MNKLTGEWTCPAAKPLGPLHAGSTAARSASRRAVSRQTSQAAGRAASRATTQGSRGGGTSDAGPEAGQSGLGAHSNHMLLTAQLECAALCLLLDLLVLVIRQAECGGLVACDLRGSAGMRGMAVQTLGEWRCKRDQRKHPRSARTT